MLTRLLKDVSEKDKEEAIKRLITDSTPDTDFFFMAVLSVLMATFGLLIDNVPVLIASMLIAPLLSPVLGIALGIVMADSKLILRSAYAIGKSFVIAIFLSSVITLFFLNFVKDGLPGYGQGFDEAYIIYFAIAVVAGIAASFASVAPQLRGALPAAAIAVTLIPPIAAIGIGIAKFDWAIISNAFIIFVINTLGIVFASMVMFSLMSLYTKRTTAHKVALAEDRKNIKNRNEKI